MVPISREVLAYRRTLWRTCGWVGGWVGWVEGNEAVREPDTLAMQPRQRPSYREGFPSKKEVGGREPLLDRRRFRRSAAWVGGWVGGWVDENPGLVPNALRRLHNAHLQRCTHPPPHSGG